MAIRLACCHAQYYIAKLLLQVTASDDDSIQLYSLDSGEPIKTLHSKKYGICRVTFSHHHTSVIYASNKVCLPFCKHCN